MIRRRRTVGKPMMVCGSGKRCILRTKLIDWDHRSRIIEHRLQSLYGKRRHCSIGPPRPRSKRLSGPGGAIARLARSVLHHMTEEQPQVKVTVAQEAQKLRSIQAMMNTFVPVTHVLDRPLTISKKHLRPTQLLPSYLADLPPICLGCIPKQTVVNLIDQLIRTRCMWKLQQFNALGTRSYFQIGSALVPTWLHTYNMNQPHFSSLVGSLVLSTSPAHQTSLSQSRASTVIRGHHAQICSPRLAYKLMKRTSSVDYGTGESTDAEGPQAVSTALTHSGKHVSKRAPPASTVMIRSNTMTPRYRNRSRVTQSTLTEDGSTDGSAFDLFGPRLSRRSTSNTQPSFEHKPKKPHSPLGTPIYPLSIRANAQNPFCSRIDYQKVYTEKPVCLVNMSSTLRQKSRLRDYLNNIQIWDQFHPQLLAAMKPTTQRRRPRARPRRSGRPVPAADTAPGDQSRPVVYNTDTSAQFNSSRSRSVEDTDRRNARLQRAIQASKRNRQTEPRGTNLVVEDGIIIYDSNESHTFRPRNSRTHPIQGSLAGRSVIRSGTDAIGNRVRSQPQPDPEVWSTNSSEYDKTNSHADSLLAPYLRARYPATPPYSPIWAFGCHRSCRVRRSSHFPGDGDAGGANSGTMSDSSSRTWLHMPHPTPEVFMQAGLLESRHGLLDALDLEWTTGAVGSAAAGSPVLLELVLPQQLCVNNGRGKSMDLHHIDSPCNTMTNKRVS